MPSARGDGETVGVGARGGESIGMGAEGGTDGASSVQLEAASSNPTAARTTAKRMPLGTIATEPLEICLAPRLRG